jgi:hypothetical protein
MQQQRNAWNDYFSGTSQAQLISQQTTRQTPSSQCVYVLNCLFQSITASSAGGALYCVSPVTYLLIESSSFFSCKTSSQGGAIYFSNSNNGQSVLHTLCVNDCNGGSVWGQQVCAFVSNNALSKNYINYSSFTRCVNYQSESLSIYSGKVCCPSINLSMNKLSYYSGIYFCAYVDSNSVTCSLSYTTITDTYSSSHSCILFCTTGAKYEIKSCNILRNTQGSLSSYGTIYTYGNTMIADSCILENNANYIFYQGSSQYTFTLSNCTVDSTSNNGYLTTLSTVTKSFILALNHMSTQNCHSEYDSAGYLTAIPYVSSPTKKLFCYTCRICQGRIGDLFSITFVFMITFIYLDPSGDSWIFLKR